MKLWREFLKLVSVNRFTYKGKQFLFVLGRKVY